MPIVMGTAGHIDHGKTTLIKALTGIDCDRLAEEKKRGITIELGFAYLDLPDGTRVSIVDVPGHEKFVKNMVAGAAGIDFVLLVVAADEGIMPQTEEHLEICSLLGINRGLVVLTKVDMVDEEWLTLVKEEVQEYLKNTFLRDAPIVSVSSHTGKGLQELQQVILEQVQKIRKNRIFDVFRLPVDRVFTLHGHGTVITGTTISGKIKTGEDIEIYPKGILAKVRSVQVHSESKEVAQAGERTALNLQGIEKEKIDRGNVLARPGTLFPSKVWTIELHCLSTAAKPLKHRTEIHFHHGSKEILARIYLLDRDELKPGEKALAQVRFPEPMVGVFQDRFVIRSFSPLRTIGGGIVLDPMSVSLKRRSPEIKYFKNLVNLNASQLILNVLNRQGIKGLNFDQLLILTNLRSKDLQKELQILSSKQEVFLVEKDIKLYVGKRVVEKLSNSLLDFLTQFHSKNELLEGITRSQLLSSWGKNYSDKLVNFLIDKLTKENKIKIENKFIKLFSHKVKVKGEKRDLLERIFKIIETSGFNPPNFKEIKDKFKLDTKELNEILALLEKEKKIVKINNNFYYAVSIAEKLKQLLLDFFAKQQEMTLADFKSITGLSRKYTIPLLEYFDRQKITMRIGDKRVLRKKS
ncbi:selenocysteine-specific elongation factor [Desulfonauticus submarinus]|uniref:Selenocysteine-specific elongation factor n=1 Tax=Desulfonauticus submarinus TaxID=206665 RepID=A0A1H0CDG2_9BACT|nr:selenocysteine-specific translation elongation factor [Desulfonauticus submarinus]SDN55938.1 selenocysteine-specific elongation factor [Desulfonauticus submarinus]